MPCRRGLWDTRTRQRACQGWRRPPPLGNTDRCVPILSHVPGSLEEWPHPFGTLPAQLSPRDAAGHWIQPGSCRGLGVFLGHLCKTASKRQAPRTFPPWAGMLGRHELGEKGLSVSESSAKDGLVVLEESAPWDREAGEASWLSVIIQWHSQLSQCDSNTGARRVQRPPTWAGRGPRAQKGLGLHKHWH